MVYLKTDEYRKRLMSISWFMKLLNEHIAKLCNQEDDVKGHFYDLHPCKSHFVPPAAFKFDPIKFSGTIEKLKKYIKNIKQKIKNDVGLNPALE